jgi:hypothetical protein
MAAPLGLFEDEDQFASKPLTAHGSERTIAQGIAQGASGTPVQRKPQARGEPRGAPGPRRIVMEAASVQHTQAAGREILEPPTSIDDFTRPSGIRGIDSPDERVDRKITPLAIFIEITRHDIWQCAGMGVCLMSKIGEVEAGIVGFDMQRAKTWMLDESQLPFADFLLYRGGESRGITLDEDIHVDEWPTEKEIANGSANEIEFVSGALGDASGQREQICCGFGNRP